MKRQSNSPADTKTTSPAVTASATAARSRLKSRQTQNGEPGSKPEMSSGVKRKEALSMAVTAGPISLLFVALAIWLLNNMDSGNIFLLVAAVLCIAWGAGGLIFMVNQLLAAYDTRD